MNNKEEKKDKMRMEVFYSSNNNIVVDKEERKHVVVRLTMVCVCYLLCRTIYSITTVNNDFSYRCWIRSSKKKVINISRSLHSHYIR